MRDVCYHDCCDKNAVPGKPFCALHTAHATVGCPTAKPYYCCHPGCFAEPVEGTELCEGHLVMEPAEQPVCEADPCNNPAEDGFVFCRECSSWAGRILRDRPTTEDLASEHDEVLAEVSEALAIWDRETDDAMDEHWHAGEAQKLVSAHRKRAQIHEDKARQALANLSPEAREQLEARRVVVLDGTTYIVDASGDELQLVACDPWVIS